jgi:hypothetical protein
VSAPDIVLHIGAMKTGTSYLQSLLSRNAERLAAQGVAWPGVNWRAQEAAAMALLRGDSGPDNAWDALVADIEADPAPRAVVSMEFLSFADAEAVARVQDSLAGRRVRVVLTLRDLGRVLPAHWQESVQNGKHWSYTEYLAGVTSPTPRTTRAGRHFWGKQSWGRILRTWQPLVAAEDLVVVTVPRSGADPTLLWTRFCTAAALDGADVDRSGFANDSLGATSAELMRRLNARVEERGLPPETLLQLKRSLAKRVLVHRKDDEPRVGLPPELGEWLAERSSTEIRRVRRIAPVVVGDLDELVPATVVARPGVTTDPGASPDGALLDAAVDGMLGLLQRSGGGGGRGRS